MRNVLWPLAGLLIILLTQCETTPTVVTDVNCMAWRVIVYSSADTEATIRQVREHNAVMKELCPNG